MTFPLLLVNTVFHETVVDAVTLYVFAAFVPLVVLTVAGDAALVRVIVGSVYSTVPVQLALLWSVNTTEPFNAVPAPDVIVAESFGNQFCAEVAEVVSWTRKHSESPVPVCDSATG